MSSSWPHDPVVVVGGGPVGQTAALLLARWGVPSLVLDRRPARDLVGSKAICQQRDVLDVWASVGAERIAAEGVTWSVARTFHRDRELFAHTFTDAGQSPFPPFVNLSQSRTEEILDECIAAQPLVELRWGCDVDAVHADGRVQVRGRTLAAPFVLLCTGSAGAVRRALGVQFDGSSFPDRFLICDIRTDLPGWATERRFYFDPAWNPGRQVLVHPCPDATFRIDWQVPADFDLDAEFESGALDQRIRAVIGERAYTIVWMSVYRFHARIADRMRVGRVLLAGDAAHLVAPFGARGLNSGVQDAENAAWKIAHVGRGWAPEDLLASYHDERYAAARENLAISSATMEFLAPPDPERAAHRADVLARAVDDPAARADVDSGRLAEPFWYVESPLTTPDPTRPFAGRPARGTTPPAAPGVLVPDVPLTGYAEGSGPRRARLRELARDGFLLLSTPGSDLHASRVAAAVTDAPVRVATLRQLDPTGVLEGALDARPGETWMIRPDAHVAAVVAGSTADLVDALQRALGKRIGAKEADRAVLPQPG